MDFEILGTVRVMDGGEAVALFVGDGNSVSDDAGSAPLSGAALVDRGPELGTVSSPRQPVVGAAAVDRGPELGTVPSPDVRVVGAASVDRGPELGTVPPQQSDTHGISPMGSRAEGIPSLRTGR